MNTLQKWTLGAAIIALVLGGVAVFKPSTVTVGGQLNETDPKTFHAGIYVSQTGTKVSGVNFGTCNLITNGTIAASSTRNFDCAFTGVVPTDKVFASLQATSTPAFGGVGLVGVKASSTANYITFTVSNYTQATYAANANSFGSSTAVLIIR